MKDKLTTAEAGEVRAERGEVYTRVPASQVQVSYTDNPTSPGEKKVDIVTNVRSSANTPSAQTNASSSAKNSLYPILSGESADVNFNSVSQNGNSVKTNT